MTGVSSLESTTASTATRSTDSGHRRAVIRPTMLMPADRPVPRILYVASGPAPLAVEVLGLLRQRFPSHQIDLVVSQLSVDRLPPSEREHVAFVAGHGKG